jgi:hypothetical protein
MIILVLEMPKTIDQRRRESNRRLPQLPTVANVVVQLAERLITAISHIDTQYLASRGRGIAMSKRIQTRAIRLTQAELKKQFIPTPSPLTPKSIGLKSTPIGRKQMGALLASRGHPPWALKYSVNRKHWSSWNAMAILELVTLALEAQSPLELLGSVSTVFMIATVKLVKAHITMCDAACTLITRQWLIAISLPKKGRRWSLKRNPLRVK